MLAGIRTSILLPLLLVAACDGREESAIDNLANGANSTQVENNVRAEAMALMEPLNPPAPGTPGGLPVDPAPLAEGSIDPDSAQGAAQVVQGYYGLLEEKRFEDAQDLWDPEGAIGAQDDAHFEARFRGFGEIHANIGAPSDPEGAAGSSYVTVPVQLYGRIKANGKPFYTLRQVVLRRVNDVPGSTETQRRWHIESIAAYVPPKVPPGDNAAEPPKAISMTDGMADKP
ncbi:hypothetical protein [Sphingobium sp. YR768]|uniref:hypothetical protein n=1 Tax=Sphingobium sp. YR768 TaxID=1884365 RepID=UPI0008CE3FA5|nr:hypothetical protein [Sphingobium sp. YR768]SER39410.1 hypothetical protein SAMN05518866_11063 [Sphingobium sp. YR768]